MHTGTVRVIGNDYWGVDVHYAARLCAAASGGQVLLSASTREVVRGVVVDDLGEHGLKDFTVPRPLFHLRVGGAGADRFPPPRTLARVRTNLPSSQNVLIGRERDLAELREGLKGEVRLLTVTGVGGSGKTRLALACGADLLHHSATACFWSVWRRWSGRTTWVLLSRAPSALPSSTAAIPRPPSCPIWPDARCC